MASSTSAGEKSATKKDTEKASSSSKTQSKSRSSKSSGSSKASASPTASKSARERHEEEVREIQIRNHEDRLVHRPAEVQEDAVQPRVDRGLATEAVRRFQRLQEGFLHQILRLGGIAAQQIGRPKQPIAVGMQARPHVDER